jgi:hypothetical protein
MSDDNAIIQDLIGALSSNTVELNNLTRQVAAQGDTLNEVKRHSESVKKSVDWTNLGDDVYEGVAAATTAKIEETLDASAKIVAQAEALGTASIDQSSAVEDLRNALKTTSEEKREATRATERLHSAAEALMATHRGGFARMLLVGALTASLGLFGGYFYAKDSLERLWMAELGDRLRGPNGEENCGYAKGDIQSASNGNPACIFWLGLDQE